MDDVTKQSLSSAILQKELEDDLQEFELGTSTTSYQTFQPRRRLDAVTKQSLSSAIFRKDLQDDLPKFEFGTLTISCQNFGGEKMGRKHGTRCGYIPTTVPIKERLHNT